MAANLEIRRYISTSQARDAIYNGFLQFSTLDSAAISSGNSPVGKPTDGSTAFSYDVWISLYMTQVPDNTVDNVLFWRGGQLDEGFHMFVGTSHSSTLKQSFNYQLNAILNTTDYVSPGTALLWSGNALTAIGDSTYPLCLQMNIMSSAATGDYNSNEMICHYSYDEA